MSDQSEAAKRAAARKAKILARGNTGLQKLAQTARGEEAEKLYGQDSSSATPKSPSSPAPQNASGQPSWAPLPPSGNAPSSTRPTSSSSSAQAPSQGTAGRPELTSEQRKMQRQMEQMMSMFGGPPPGAGGAGTGPDAGMPDMQQMLARMLGVDPGTMGGGAGGVPRLGMGDMDDPAGLGGGAGGLPDLSALGGLGGLGGAGGMNGFPGMGGMGAAPGFGARKTKVERFYPMVHVLGVLSLVLFILLWWEPQVLARRYPAALSDMTGLTGSLGGWSKRWALMSAKGAKAGPWTDLKVRLRGVQALPVFWAFVTVELMLQTTRFVLLKSPTPPHSLISTFLPLLPPNLARPLVTGSRYLSFLSQIYKDGCLLVFALGMTVVLAESLNAYV